MCSNGISQREIKDIIFFTNPGFNNISELTTKTNFTIPLVNVIAMAMSEFEGVRRLRKQYRYK